MYMALKDFVKKFVLRDMEYKILNNKAPKVEKYSIRVWKKLFRVLTPMVDEREG